MAYALIHAFLAGTANAFEQHLAYSLVGLFTLLLHTLTQPFVQQRLNLLETVALSLLIAIPAVLSVYSPPYSSAVDVLLFLLVVPFAALLLALIVFSRLTTIASKFTQRKKSAGSLPAPTSRTSIAVAMTAATKQESAMAGRVVATSEEPLSPELTEQQVPIVLPTHATMPGTINTVTSLNDKQQDTMHIEVEMIDIPLAEREPRLTQNPLHRLSQEQIHSIS